MTRSAATLVAVLAAAALAAAGCGGSSSSSKTTSTSRSTSTSGGGTSGSSTTRAASRLAISAAPNGALKFSTSKLTAKAGRVTITMTNPSSAGIAHAIALTGNGVTASGATANPGGTSTVTATLEPGTYTFYCPVDAHRQAGMQGTLTAQ